MAARAAPLDRAFPGSRHDPFGDVWRSPCDSSMVRAMTERQDRKDNLVRLLEIMERLRDPETGCPWDVEQDFRSIAPYTIEEAYEVADAIERDDMAALRDELGDLLLQVVFHARMAEEAGKFDFDDVAAAISEKMVRRHPHVFAGESRPNVAEQRHVWEDMKASERGVVAEDGNEHRILDGVAVGLPGLTRAEKLQKRAARVGFDWTHVIAVFDKIEEEISEIKQEIADGAEPDRCAGEIGDLLFAVVNLARHLDVDCESALRRTNAKFERRFKTIEARFGERLPGADLHAMEKAWQAAKDEEAAGDHDPPD